MTLKSPEIKDKISEWESELREMTGDPLVRIRAYYPMRNYETIEKVAEAVCEETKIDLILMRAKTRQQHVVTARQLVCYFARKLTRMTLMQIGLFLGGRDHTTIIHSSDHIDDLLEAGDPVVCDLVQRIYLRLNHEQRLAGIPK